MTNGGNPGHPASAEYFGDLFAREPERWGLRGDPHLWRALRAHFAGTPMPRTWFDVNRLLEQGFQTITGSKLDKQQESLYLKKFSIGSGMSDGSVSPQWWATIGEALIVDRWAALSATAAAS